jgi:hypothetical protein
MAFSLVIILGWQLTIGVQQYIDAIRMGEQQAVVAKQAAQTESKLQAMMTDLLLLSRTDEEAQKIVAKYNIKMNADKSGTGGSRAPVRPASGTTPSAPAPSVTR